MSEQTNHPGEMVPNPQEPVAIDELIRRHVRADGRRLEDASLIETGVPIWVVIGHDISTDGDTASVREHYGLSAEAVEAARAWYCRHKEIVDARLTLVRASFS